MSQRNNAVDLLTSELKKGYVLLLLVSCVWYGESWVERNKRKMLVNNEYDVAVVLALSVRYHTPALFLGALEEGAPSDDFAGEGIVSMRPDNGSKYIMCH